METAEERRARIESQEIVILVFVILGLSAYIAHFTGDRFIEVQETRPTD